MTRFVWKQIGWSNLIVSMFRYDSHKLLSHPYLILIFLLNVLNHDLQGRIYLFFFFSSFYLSPVLSIWVYFILSGIQVKMCVIDLLENLCKALPSQCIDLECGWAMSNWMVWGLAWHNWLTFHFINLLEATLISGVETIVRIVFRRVVQFGYLLDHHSSLSFECLH